MEDNTVLSLDGLCVGYGKKQVVSDISFSIKAGETVCLIGPNGAGKSTILKTIAKMIPPVSGKAVLLGRDIRHIKETELARNVSCMFPQVPDTLYLTCSDIVENGRYPYTGMFGRLSGSDRDKVNESMEATGVTELAGRYFHTLSDGQKQRVMFARAICQEPKLLLLDEPASFLDIRYKLELLELIRKFSKERGTAVLFSMHEITLAGRTSDRMIAIKNGKVDSMGRPEDMLDPGHIEELYDLKKGSLKDGMLNGIF
ncbi:MAG: ABC transporter ATP-binding protein [Lachnospiraceae bacterium]|nr:ABC transporter ATP-binding protein [Lachnospiraceae bacterium]